MSRRPDPAITVHRDFPERGEIRRLCKNYTFVRFEGFGTLDFSVEPPAFWPEEGASRELVDSALVVLRLALGTVVLACPVRP